MGREDLEGEFSLEWREKVVLHCSVWWGARRGYGGRSIWTKLIVKFTWRRTACVHKRKETQDTRQSIRSAR